MYYSLYEEDNLPKTPVVLIHGAGADHLYWPVAIRRLPGQHVLCIDLPGHGKSEGTGYQSIWSYAQWLVSFLADLEIYQAIFVGHSMGGCIALALAIEHPNQVAGLALISTAAHIEFPGGILEQAAQPASFPLVTEMLVQRTFSPAASPNLLRDATRRLGESRSSLLFGDLMACAAFDVHDRLDKIHAPTLVMAGNDDLITPPACARALAVSLAGAKLKILPDAGHMLQLEQPNLAAAALKSYLSQFSS
jgi:pimeloyl-ACP methyl ester carboxylesterase